MPMFGPTFFGDPNEGPVPSCVAYEQHKWTAWRILVNPDDPGHEIRRCTLCGVVENRT